MNEDRTLPLCTDPLCRELLGELRNGPHSKVAYHPHVIGGNPPDLEDRLNDRLKGTATAVLNIRAPHGSMTPQEREAFEAMREALESMLCVYPTRGCPLSDWPVLESSVRAALALAEKVRPVAQKENR